MDQALLEWEVRLRRIVSASMERDGPAQVLHHSSIVFVLL